jgi:glycerol-3-phosphate acyltransferase PlsY
MEPFLAILFSFLCGTLPFSVWLGKLFLNRDVRLYGDGNPGASNVFRAGNNYVGLMALLLDISKSAAPVGWFYHNWGIRGVPMFLIAIAPILGHAYSPFLKFRGGKAIATAFGAWIGLTLWKASLPGVVAATVGIAIITPPGWSVMLALGVILITLLGWLPDPLLISVWAAQVMILGWKHREDLCQFPKIRPWIQKVFRRDINDD